MTYNIYDTIVSSKREKSAVMLHPLQAKEVLHFVSKGGITMKKLIRILFFILLTALLILVNVYIVK